jgi:uncharacterized protein GlcG (DUF336 family)
MIAPKQIMGRHGMTRMMVLAGAAILAATMVSAQPAPPAPPAPPRDPLLLPSDAPPPPLERMLAPPAPPAPGQPLGVAPADTTRALDMAVAVDLARTAIAICEAQGLRVGAAVADSAGNLRVGLTGNAARAGRIFTASRKNAAVIAYGKPTSAIQAMLRADPAARAALPPHMAVMPGGVPIMVGDKIIGALAVSGAASLQDEDCANKALAQLAPRLK